jgi:hypothetical protein
MGFGWLCSLKSVLTELNKTKDVAHTNVLVGVKHIFWPVIWIQRDLGPMCFWSHGQSFSGKVYNTKVVVHLPNSNVGQVLTPTPIPLALLRVGSPKCGVDNFAASNHPHSEQSKARM